MKLPLGDEWIESECGLSTVAKPWIQTMQEDF